MMGKGKACHPRIDHHCRRHRRRHHHHHPHPHPHFNCHMDSYNILLGQALCLKVESCKITMFGG